MGAAWNRGTYDKLSGLETTWQVVLVRAAQVPGGGKQKGDLYHVLQVAFSWS